MYQIVINYIMANRECLNNDFRSAKWDGIKLIEKKTNNNKLVQSVQVSSKMELVALVRLL